MFCTKCGTQNSDDANFCIKCGTESPTSILPTTLSQEPIISKDISTPRAKISFLRWLIGGLCIMTAVFGGFAEGNVAAGLLVLLIGVITVWYPLMPKIKHATWVFAIALFIIYIICLIAFPFKKESSSTNNANTYKYTVEDLKRVLPDKASTMNSSDEYQQSAANLVLVAKDSGPMDQMCVGVVLKMITDGCSWEKADFWIEGPYNDDGTVNTKDPKRNTTQSTKDAYYKWKRVAQSIGIGMPK